MRSNEEKLTLADIVAMSIVTAMLCLGMLCLPLAAAIRVNALAWTGVVMIITTSIFWMVYRMFWFGYKGDK